MKEVRTYVCAVDAYRNGMIFRGQGERLYDRNTAGTYLVGAKSPEEARRILQKKIGFGSIEVCAARKHVPSVKTRLDNAVVQRYRSEKSYLESEKELEYGEACKIESVYDEETKKYKTVYDFSIRRATDPMPEAGTV